MNCNVVNRLEFICMIFQVENMESVVWIINYVLKTQALKPISIAKHACLTGWSWTFAAGEESS